MLKSENNKPAAQHNPDGEECPLRQHKQPAVVKAKANIIEQFFSITSCRFFNSYSNRLVSQVCQRINASKTGHRLLICGLHFLANALNLLSFNIYQQ